jgi:hypothetical protein
MNWPRLIYSIGIAIFVIALSYAFYDRWGEFVLWPGVISHVMVNGLLLAIPTGDYFLTLPSITYLVLNVTFYASIVFSFLFLMAHIKNKRMYVGVLADLNVAE